MRAPDVFQLQQAGFARIEQQSLRWLKSMEKTERKKERKPTSQITPSPTSPPKLHPFRIVVTKAAAGGVHHFFFSQSICLYRGASANLIGSLGRWFFLGFFFKAPAFRAIHYTCLPSSGAVGRGWDRCPNLCVDLPGKVERKGTKGPARQLHTNTLFLPDQSVHLERGRGLIDCCCSSWLKVWSLNNIQCTGITWRLVLKKERKKKKLFKLDCVGVSSHLAVATLH